VGRMVLHLLPRSLAKRPAVAAGVSIAALVCLTAQLPQRDVSAHHSAPVLPSSAPAADGPSDAVVGAATVRTVSVVVAGQGDLPATTGGLSHEPTVPPLRVDAFPPTRPCPNVSAWGSIARVVASPAPGSSAWTQVQSAIDTATPAGEVGEDTGAAPFVAADSSPRQARPLSFVLPGGRSGELFASDGTTLLRTRDAGCSWTPAFSLDPTASPGSVAQSGGVLRVAPGYVVTAVSARGTHVYATIAPPWWSTVHTATGGSPLVVAVSHDSGATWSVSSPQADQPVDAGSVRGPTAHLPLPAGIGYPQLLAVSPSDPKVAYLETAALANAAAVPDSGPTRMRLFVTRDGGQSWTLAPAPVRPGGASNATPLYAAGSAETYLSQLRVDPRHPDTLYGLGVETAPGTTAAGAHGLDGADTQNGLFQNDGALYVGSAYAQRWSSLASPVGPTGYGGAAMVYIDAYAVAAGVRAGVGKVALVEHYLSTASHSLTSAIFSSSDGGRHWRELPVPAALQVFLPADEGAANGGQTPVTHWGPQGSGLSVDGVYVGSQPLWLTLLPGDRGLSLGIDPAPGIPSARVSVYHRRWSEDSWTRVMTLPVSTDMKYDVRDWAFNPGAPAVDAAAGVVYALVECRTAVDADALTAANGTAGGNAKVEAKTYSASISLVSYRG
jgi:hypothetical protein